ncbi:FKBP-type peptidyl-prolyl cis-trans isomerase [Teredinibacter purpureus]|uniref:FKBP-type peptidyl-prolyl cis-trans isomerase n=1 Tax=Teredinibacter purpureus TaxID=2731756 RepID=UPI0005F7E122|nr:peptidylprolyl isomerase [Teredinibacter purpureus]
MKIENDCVVSIHYTLTDEQGEVLDSSIDAEPLKYLAGAGNIIPGLENALVGCVVGDKKSVTVPPADGYGEYIDELVQTLPRESFAGIEKIEVGMEFQAQTEAGGEQFVVVKEVTEEGISIDGNHELAGMVLNFDVTVEEVREATAEELDHGHVH